MAEPICSIITFTSLMAQAIDILPEGSHGKEMGCKGFYCFKSGILYGICKKIRILFAW